MNGVAAGFRRRLIKIRASVLARLIETVREQEKETLGTDINRVITMSLVVRLQENGLPQVVRMSTTVENITPLAMKDGETKVSGDQTIHLTDVNKVLDLLGVIWMIQVIIFMVGTQEKIAVIVTIVTTLDTDVVRILALGRFLLADDIGAVGAGAVVETDV